MASFVNLYAEGRIVQWYAFECLYIERESEHMVERLVKAEWIKPTLYALLIIGIAALLFGAFRFLEATVNIQNNMAHQIQSSGQQVDPQSESEAMQLMSADLERRAFDRQRDQALIIAGAGLALIALGWLGNDFVSLRRKAV
jgi:hypothetical protein